MSEQAKGEIDTTRAFRRHWVLWKFFGLHPPNRSSKWFKPYFVYAIILNLSISLFPASLIINLILSQNLAEFCENLYNTITDVVVNIKLLNFILMKHKVIQAKVILQTLDTRAKSSKEKETLREGVASAEQIFNILLRLTGCAMITSQMLVYLSSERVLMYPAWYPWDWKASRSKFALAHLYQVYGLITQSTQNLTNETYPLTMLILLSAHIKALAFRIKNLNSDGTKSEEALYAELTDCIKDHKIIHKY